MNKEKYDGFSNYETYRLKLNLNNDEEGLHSECMRMVESETITSEKLKKWLEECSEFHEVGFQLCDFWSYNEWRKINFEEILKALIEEAR